MRPKIFVFSMLGLVGAQCPSPSGQGSAAPGTSPTSEDVQVEMQRHFEQVTEVKNAVIDGDLDTVLELARWIAQNEVPDEYPLAWQPHIVELAETAEALAQAKDIDAAAVRVASLGGSCGNCHAAVGAKPAFDDAVEPSPGDTVRARMERHQWASDRMWEGIVMPSEPAWQRGTKTFPVFPGCDVSFDDEEHKEQMERLCAEVSALGRKAAAARDHAERTRLYGDLLSTCAACHDAGA